MTTIPPPPEAFDKPLPHPPPDSDAAWTARKAAYRQTVPYGCRRCLRAGLRGDPDQWLDCHHVWGNNRRWATGSEPDHALMWLCQPHHDALTLAHARMCRKLKIMHGSNITHPAAYSITLALFTYVYVYTGRALLTSGARAALYVAGGIVSAVFGMLGIVITVALWAAVTLWRRAT